MVVLNWKWRYQPRPTPASEPAKPEQVGKFVYRRRNLFDWILRGVQNAEGNPCSKEEEKTNGEKPVVKPKADAQTKCVMCGHRRIAHCTVARKGCKAKYLTARRRDGVSGSEIVPCKHYAAAFERGEWPPRCDSTACCLPACPCEKFVSPYTKPRAPKKTAAKRRKKPATPVEQKEFNFGEE